MSTKILIVEDEESLADPLSYLLEKEGFSTVWAADGPAALEAFEANDVPKAACGVVGADHYGHGARFGDR